jgi:hypothetical protein
MWDESNWIPHISIIIVALYTVIGAFSAVWYFRLMHLSELMEVHVNSIFWTLRVVVNVDGTLEWYWIYRRYIYKYRNINVWINLTCGVLTKIYLKSPLLCSKSVRHYFFFPSTVVWCYMYKWCFFFYLHLFFFLWRLWQTIFSSAGDCTSTSRYHSSAGRWCDPRMRRHGWSATTRRVASTGRSKNTDQSYTASVQWSNSNQFETGALRGLGRRTLRLRGWEFSGI